MIRPQDIFPRGEGSLLDADTLDGLHARDLLANIERLSTSSRVVTWDEVVGKPTSFPPTPHQHEDVPKHGPSHLTTDPVFPQGVNEGLLAAANPSASNPFVTRRDVARQWFFNDAVEWTIPHNLGRRPLVLCYTSGGLEVEGEVIHLSDNVVRVKFVAPLSGWVVIA